MGRPRGFLEIRRSKPGERPPGERVRDWREFEHLLPDAALKEQAARCMDCGVPYCHDGCPLTNLIPEWNDLVYQGRMEDAAASLHATNNFPEITGRVCPAPCEASCVLNMTGEPVTIKAVERAIADAALAEGARPRRAAVRTGKKVAVVGSGPAGLAAAQELARRGHHVVVFEKDDRIGGLLRYGIPDFKMEKPIIDRRMEQMRQEGVEFRPGVHVGVDITGAALQADHDAIVLAGGAGRPRDLGVPGRELDGIHFAMDFLTQQNRRNAGDHVPAEGAILAAGKRVIVLGGGDTGSDCVGTSHRQGAASVLSLELLPRPPDERRADNPWPQWPLIYRTSSSHAEGGERDFGVMTKRVLGKGGRVVGLETVGVELDGGRLRERPGSERTIPADLVLLAMGFLGPVTTDIVAQLGCALDARGNVATVRGATSVPGVFAAGDMARGQSLVVWAIAEGRRAAQAVDRYLQAEAQLSSSSASIA
ncbi:MAG TPA: glutamate synthase subunit beta [Haliangiales bacterium]|nr:glutamate synthase subunit beta [Haliangiales bacterium]